MCGVCLICVDVITVSGVFYRQEYFSAVARYFSVKDTVLCIVLYLFKLMEILR